MLTSFISFPSIDPVIFPIYGPIALRWYNLAYMVGLFLGWVYCRYLARIYVPAITAKILDDLLVWSLVGIFLGGRLGHILFYEPSLYFQNPLYILKTWEGGMSFHGGLMGVLIAFYLFHKIKKAPFSSIIDLAAAAAPIGLFFGRIANFINDELYGRVTSVPWAVMFPSGGYIPRHPSQLYEAALEGVGLFLLIFFFIKYKKALLKPGYVSGLFLLGYGISRFFVEFFREPDGFFSILTIGQALSIPMIMVGIYLILPKIHEKRMRPSLIILLLLNSSLSWSGFTSITPQEGNSNTAIRDRGPIVFFFGSYHSLPPLNSSSIQPPTPLPSVYTLSHTEPRPPAPLPSQSSLNR